MIRALIAMGVVVGLGGAAASHERWADGSAVPEWVLRACCGPTDSHMLTAERRALLGLLSAYWP